MCARRAQKKGEKKHKKRDREKLQQPKKIVIQWNRSDLGNGYHTDDIERKNGMWWGEMEYMCVCGLRFGVIISFYN